MGKIKELYELHQILSSLSFQEFENLIFDVVLTHFGFNPTEVVRNADELGFDIKGQNEKLTVLVEAKVRKLIGVDEIQTLGYLWNSKTASKAKHILATTGSLTNEASIRAKALGIEVWDVYNLNTLITPHIWNKHFYGEVNSGLGEEPEPTSFQTIEDKLIERLRLTPFGGKDSTTHWSSYQKLVSDILEHLFCPPLEPPRFEESDYDNRNRRDIIFENSCNSGFWSNIRNKYAGDYIVVDAKNYGKPIEKRSVIELAHYLKPYGCGLFGLIVSRHKESDAAFHAIKEQWIGSKKMIINLCDDDLIEMLRIKSRNPEELIRRKIADFRMKL